MRHEFRTSLSWFLILSMGVHALLIVYKASTFTPPPTKMPESIEIVEIPKEYLDMQQQQETPAVPVPKAQENKQAIAETEDLNNEIDPNAKFLGEHNQKVDKETKSSRIDDFRKKQGTGAKGILQNDNQSIPPTGETSEEEEKESDVASNEPGLKPAPDKKGVKRTWKTLSLHDLSVGGDGGAESATDDRLDGVDHGERTMLSTKEYKFYSYYHRIKELLRQYWKPYVEREITRMWQRGKAVKDEELLTRLLVLLDEKGNIQKISRIASCGVRELDEAAMDAFKRASPFPNPPQGMLDPDGFVRINWDFILTTETGVRIQWRQAGPGRGLR